MLCSWLKKYVTVCKNDVSQSVKIVWCLVTCDTHPFVCQCSSFSLLLWILWSVVWQMMKNLVSTSLLTLTRPSFAKLNKTTTTASLIWWFYFLEGQMLSADIFRISFTGISFQLWHWCGWFFSSFAFSYFLVHLIYVRFQTKLCTIFLALEWLISLSACSNAYDTNLGSLMYPWCFANGIH